jgi:hypothetical protein
LLCSTESAVILVKYVQFKLKCNDDDDDDDNNNNNNNNRDL